MDIDEANVLYNNYDQAGQRTVKELRRTIPNTLGGENIYLTKNIYPNSLYEEEVSGLEEDEQNWQTKKIRHITLGNQTIAHIDVNPQGQAEKILVFSDHLGSSSLLTDSMGRVKTLYDYYPFGGTRLDSSDGLHVSAYQYTGKELDDETGLNYYGARYYEAAMGRFTQQDAVALAIASPDTLKDIIGQDQQGFLTNPQALNSYSYTLNNPIKYIDPDGNSQSPFDGYNKAVGKLAKMLGRAIDKWLNNAKAQQQAVRDQYAAEYDNLSDQQKGQYDSKEMYVLTKVVTDQMGDMVMGMAGGGAAGNSAKVASGLKVGQSFGKLGKVIENIAGKITSYSQHALARMDERGLSIDLMNSIVSNPLVTLKQAGEKILYLTREGAVVLDKTGRAVTTYTKNEFKPHILDVLKLIK